MKYFNALLAISLVASYPVLAQEGSGTIDEAPYFSQDVVGTSALNGAGQVNDALYGVLAQAYENNPTIKAARAEFSAVEEQLNQAKSGYLPTVTADADVTHIDTDATGSPGMVSDGGNTSKTVGLNLNQPLYRGGSTQANVKQAQNIIAAQQFNLSSIEQKALYDVVVAYMNLYQEKVVLSLRENNKTLVAQELEQAQNRFKVGEITRTDVSQSEARLADARASVINAQAAVKTSIATFRQLVGTPPPADMGYPVMKFELPENLEAAIALALTNNRDILQAQFSKQAAQQNVNSIQGELLPQVNAAGSLNKSYDVSDFIEEQRQALVGLNVSVPLYTGGATRSRIREARKTELQRREQINIAKAQVRQQIISNWENWQAAQGATQARVSQVDASMIAHEGVRYETEFGERTTLDALNANQELLSAQVELVKSKRDEIVARFAIAQSLGLLVPQNLGFSTVNP